MALSVQELPQTVMAAVWNPVVFAWTDSDITTYNLTDYKFEFEVFYRVDSNDAYVSTGIFQLYPDTTGTAYFDVSRILQNFMESDFRYNVSGFDTVNPQQCIQYKVNLYRDYVQTGVRHYEFLTTFPDGAKVFDAAVSLNEYNQWDIITDDIMTGFPVQIKRPISNVPTGLKLNRNEWYTLQLMPYHPIFGGSLWIKTMVVTTYDINGLQKIFIKTRTNDTDVSKQFMAVGIGPANLTALGIGPNVSESQGWSINYGAFPVFDDQVVYYTVEFYLQDDTTLAVPTITVMFDQDWCTYRGNDKYWLVYKNKLGGYSWLKFEAKMYKSVKVVKEQYQKKVDFKKMLTSGGKYLRGDTSVGNDIQEKYTLNSEYANVSEQDFFEELIVSPSVFMLKPINNLGNDEVINDVIPVSISDSTYTILKKNTVNLVQYTIEVIAALPKNVQRQ